MWKVAGGAAVALVLATTGCSGSSGDSRGSGSSTEEGEAGAGLPSAGTMAEIESFVSEHATCTSMSLRPDDPDEEWVGKEWGIKERGVCYDENRAGINLLVVDDMKTFQAQAKKQRRAYFVGRTLPSTPGAQRSLRPCRTQDCCTCSARIGERSPAVSRRNRRSWTAAS